MNEVKINKITIYNKGFNKKWEKIFEKIIKKRIVIIYGNTQTGKSTIAKSILVGFGSNNIDFKKSKINNIKCELEISYNNRKLNLINSYPSSSTDKFTNEFNEFNQIKIPSNNKYKSTYLTISDLMQFLFSSQKRDNIENDNMSNKLIHAKKWIKLYLIDPKNYSFSEKANELSLIINKISNEKNNQKIKGLISKEITNVDPDKKINLIDIEKNINSKRNELSSNYKEINFLKDKIQNDEDIRTFISSFRDKLSKINIKINNDNYDLLTILETNDIANQLILTSLSIEEIVNMKDRINELQEKNKEIRIDLKELEKNFDAFDEQTKIFVYSKAIKNILSNSEDIHKLEQRKKELLEEIENENNKVDNKIDEFDKNIDSKLSSLGFSKADEGSGQQLETLIRLINYQKNVCLPIIFDAFGESFDIYGFNKIIQLILQESKGQFFLFYTLLDNNDEIIKMIENNYSNDIQLIKLE